MVEPKTELQRNAILNARRHELTINQRALDMQWLDSRMEDGRMGQLLARIEREAAMEKEFQERTDHAAIVNARSKKEAALGSEIQQVEREATCQYMRRHFLRQNDQSLKELQRKLAAAYNCRDIQQQILHNEYRRMQEKAEERRANEQLKAALLSGPEEAEEEERMKMERDTKYRLELQQQLVNKQLQKQCEFEEKLIEKKMLDDIMKTLEVEDMKELEQKRILTAQTRAEMETFHQARLAWRDKQKRMLVLEEKEFEKQAQAQSDRMASLIAERQRRLRAKEERNEKMGAEIIAEEERLKERADIIRQLQEQEFLEKNYQDDIKEKEKDDRAKKEVLAALDAQVKFKKQQIVDQKRREAEFRKQTEEKVKQEEEKERQKEIVAKEKRKAYAAELKVLAEKGARKKEFLRKQEEDRAKLVWEYHKAWDAEVAQERRKIIKEHVPHLVGYIQAGVIRETDVDAIKEGVQQHDHLSGLDIAAIADTSKRAPPKGRCNAQCMVLRTY